MAKREILRQTGKTEQETATTDSAAQAVVETNPPMEKNSVDVVVTISKRPSVVAIRALRGVLLFNDGFKMRKEKLDPAKPVIVRISQ